MKNKYEYEYVGLTGIELDRIARSGRQPSLSKCLEAPHSQKKIKRKHHEVAAVKTASQGILTIGCSKIPLSIGDVARAGAAKNDAWCIVTF
jgi:heterodisulfide reductase subunit A-like polyferredoxin